jgi:surfeit locus 1 family protein
VSARLRFWLVLLAALGAFAGTLRLGDWQLSRGAQKDAFAAAIVAQGARAPVDGDALAAAQEPLLLLHRVVNLRGRWLAAKTVYLDNRQMNAKQGFYVVTPLQLEGGSAVVLVQRGWAPRNFENRAALPPVDTPAGTVALQGRVEASPAKLLDLGAAAESGAIRQNLDLAQYRQETGLPLLAVSVQQTGAASEGLLREWPAVDSGASRNYGYAVQWFALAGLIAILYVWFQIVKPLCARRR